LQKSQTIKGKSHNKRVGYSSEEYVSKYLEKNGFKILDRNFVIQGGEIDLVCIDKDEIVFVEVKSLSSKSQLMLEQTITKKKTKSLIKTCRVWLSRKGLENCEWRIDFVGVIFERYDKIITLKHIRNAIY
jgi:putative endonuclease